MLAAKPLLVRDLVVRRRDTDGRIVTLLNVPHLSLEPGALLGVSGPSGAGKSTLLAALCGLIRPDSGSVTWGETDVSALPEGRRDGWRSHAGFIFQDIHLIGELSAIENVLLPLRFSHFSARSHEKRAGQLLATMGLVTPTRRASLLSRGEQQRVALARALLLSPPVLFADEPTAALDAKNGGAVTDILLDHAQQSGATLIVVSHDEELLARLPRRITLREGWISEDR
jgi:putative ABC transport system ATP-binding protein